MYDGNAIRQKWYDTGKFGISDPMLVFLCT